MEDAMKVQKIKAGASLEVGDMICNDSWTGKSWHKIVRITEKFAVVQWNSVWQGKFPRIVTEFMRPSGKRDIWSTTQYSAWRPVKEAPVAPEAAP
jgi:hypothetical protein